MRAGLVEKPQNVQAKAGATPVGNTNNAALKGELKGKPYDEQVQMLTPGNGAPPPAQQAQAPVDDRAPTPAPEANAPTPTPPALEDKAPVVEQEDAQAPAAEAQPAEAGEQKSEADQLRETIANRAKAKSGKEVMDAKQKQKVLAGMANFTTCIEFARSTMSEGSAEMYKGDPMKANATGAAMSDAKVAWETAQGERTKARNYEGYAAKFEAKVAEFKGKAEAARTKAAELRVRVEGESDARYKQRTAQAPGLESNARILDTVARDQQKQVDNYKKMAEAAIKKADDLDAANKAMIKAEPGLGSRPKAGEFIILAQGPEGKMYGKPGSEKFLAAGSFKHIAVFMGLIKDDAEYETWQVTEGGGDLAETNEIRVRKKDLLVFTKYNAANDLGSAQGSQLAGWIDAGELIKMRDMKNKK
jgi:hypothetical protein